MGITASAADGFPHPLMRPVELIDVKVVYVQMQLLFTQLTRGDGIKVGP